MNSEKQKRLRQLHEIENDLIQIDGLLEALHQVQCDQSAPVCVTIAIRERWVNLKDLFYKYWSNLQNESHEE